ncbi:hypothetical protein AAFH68_08390 [Flavobacterium sp. CGRL1]
MSTNHNRIKVADLEVNQPDKILTTNSKGELDFTDIKNIKAESYNGLDYTQEGKALDARQGKALKDSLDNLNSNLNEKENTSNKVQDIEINKNSSTAFPSIKSIYDWSKGLFKTWILGIENFSSTAYTLNAENINKRTVFSSSSPVTITIPNDSAISLPIGTKKEFTQKGTGLVTIIGSGINFVTNTSLSMLQGETIILTKINSNEWTIEGRNSIGILPNVSNEFTEVQKFNKGIFLVDDESSSPSRKKLIARSNPNNQINTNPTEFDFVASGRHESPGWFGLFNFIHKNGSFEVLGAKFSLDFNTNIPIATFYGKVNILNDLTIAGAFVSSYVRLARNNDFILDGGTYNGTTYSIKTSITSPKRIAEYRVMAGGGPGWHSVHRFIVKSNNDATERSALEIESQDNGVCKINTNGILKITQLDLSSLGVYENDNVANQEGVPIGYGYINSITGTLQRRLV